jgi:membrane-associated PAP2 superfamily phosphatase
VPRTAGALHGSAERFLLLHVLLIPAAFALAGVAAHAGGLDMRVSAAFYDPAAGAFLARRWPLFETLGHQLAKALVFAVWLTVLGGAIAARFVPALRVYRAVLWTTLGAMALGPLLVVVLKDINAYRCPWDLRAFGGVAEVTRGWFVAPMQAGRCFPSGHAAGGFSLVALAFAGIAIGHRGLHRTSLIAALAAGTLFSGIRVAQGAHFVSHNLWSAAIDWCMAALVFVPLVRAAHGGTANGDASAMAGSASWAEAWLRRIPAATRWSLAGLRATWCGEVSFRQEVTAAALALPVALFAAIGVYERLALIASLVLVLVVELLNTAIEAVVDLVSPQPHPLARAAKDAGSAAVFLSILLACAVWVVVFWPL